MIFFQRDVGGMEMKTLHEGEHGADSPVQSNNVEVGGGGGGKRSDSLLPLVLPHVPNHKRVIYTIYEYDPLLDSSNMTMDDWIQVL